MISRKSRGQRALSLLLNLAIAIAIGHPMTASTRAHSPDPSLGSGTFPQDGTLEYDWRTGAVPPAPIRVAVNAAAADIEATRESRAALFAYDAAGTNPIGYGTGTCGVNGLACFTRDAPDGFTMWFREHGRVFDWGTLKWCQMYTSAPNGCYDAETVALDEFGHIEGLGHHVNFADDRDYTDAVVQTFSRTKPREGYNMHVLGVCDVARLQVRYDTEHASFPYSTCLDLPTKLSLSGNDTTLPYGGTETFTAFLEIVTDADYGRLSGNPVSRRTIKLQRRPPGGSTWTTIATMPYTTPTGTYVSALRLYGSAEFRAVFSTPTNEGLRGDVSPTVSVTVAPCAGTHCPMPVIAH